MSDGSFRLVDSADNEIAFAPDGRCQSARAGDRWVPKYLLAGPYRIDFGYGADTAGRPIVESARLSTEGSSRALRTMRYDYDDNGRLRSVAATDDSMPATQPVEHLSDKKTAQSAGSVPGPTRTDG